MIRTGDKFPGWVSMLDPDPLTVEPPPEIGVCPVCGWPVGDLTGHVALAHPKPEPRRAGCSVFGLILLLVALASWTGPRVVAAEPEPEGEVGTVLIGGWASWYDDPRKDGRYAAAGPLLREALGNWRGKTIRVTSGNRATLVALSDFCACGERHGVPTIIDLSPDAFADLAPLAQGLVRVEIEIVALPATDTPDQSVCDPPEHPDDRRMRLEDRPLPATDTVE